MSYRFRVYQSLLHVQQTLARGEQQSNLTATTFLLSLALIIKHNKIEPFLNTGLQTSKELKLSPKYSNVLLLVESFFCNIKHCCRYSKFLYFDQRYFRTHVKRFLSALYTSKL